MTYERWAPELETMIVERASCGSEMRARVPSVERAAVG